MNALPGPFPLLLAALTAAVLPNSSSAQTRPFTAEDMLSVVQISGPVAVSPSGEELAYVLPDLNDEWNVGERVQVGRVHVLQMGGLVLGAPTPVGPPDQRSSFPAFSPDGTRVALYLEGPDGGRLAVWNSATGRLRAVGTRFEGRAWIAPQWASDTLIVYARADAPQVAGDPPRVQVLESTDQSLPGDAVFRNQRRGGVAIVDLETGEERTLLEDGELLRRFDISPDGRHVLVSAGGQGTLLVPLDGSGEARAVAAGGARVSWMGRSALSWSRDRQVFLDTTAPGDEPMVVLSLPEAITNVVWAPNALRFASLVPDPSINDPEIEPPQPGMYTIAQPFMDLYLLGEDPVGTNLTSEISDQVRSPVWSADGSSLFFVTTDNATYDETLYRYDVADESLTALAHGRESYGNIIPVPEGILVSIQSATAPEDLWRIDARTGERTRVTDLNPQLASFAFSDPELFDFDNADGERLGALLYRPAGGNGETGVPVITYVYEKLTPGIHRFAPRQQLFATHGYAMLMPNVKVKVGETGTSFVKAVVPALAAVRDMGFSIGRACLWGGSFGAYATSFIITQTNVFDCAVSRATPPELFRNWASGRDRDSDNIESGQARMGGSPFEVMERYLSQSAFFHLDQVETPVLIMHGEKDYTILFEEGAMMFYALRRLGKAATFVAYREGDHSLYRHSREDALDVHRRMLAWFEKYLRQ